MISEQSSRAFCKRFVRFALGKASGLPGSEILDTATLAAKIKWAERRCNDFNDYFRVIGQARGLFGIHSLAPIQKETEISGLIRIAAKLPLKSVMEIGTGNGGTFCMLCQAAESDAILLDFDNKNDYKRAGLLRACSKRGQEIFVIRGNSRSRKIIEEVMRALGSRTLDLLFIDGDHSLTGVASDFELYSKLVRPGGLIAFHDINPDHRTRYGIESPGYAGDVHRFWNVIKSRWRSRELVDSYDQDGMGIGVIEWDPTRV